MDLQKTFEKVLNSTGKKRLVEQKIPASLTLIYDEMKKRPKIAELLHMPVQDLIAHPKYKNYKYLLDDVNLSRYKHSTLLDLIVISIQLLKDTVFFSMNPDTQELRGFFAYIEDTNSDKFVEDIKMFSFDPDGDQTLVMDLTGLIKDLASKYEIVSWSAVLENRANRGYNIALKRMKRDSHLNYIAVKNDNRIRYFVSKIKKDTDLFEFSKACGY